MKFMNIKIWGFTIEEWKRYGLLASLITSGVSIIIGTIAILITIMQ